MKTYNKLASIRKEKGITQEELANAVGVSKQFIWDIEDGRRNLSYKLVFKISNVLETTPDKLFLDDYKKSQKN